MTQLRTADHTLVEQLDGGENSEAFWFAIACSRASPRWALICSVTAASGPAGSLLAGQSTGSRQTIRAVTQFKQVGSGQDDTQVLALAFHVSEH